MSVVIAAGALIVAVAGQPVSGTEPERFGPATREVRLDAQVGSFSRLFHDHGVFIAIGENQRTRAGGFRQSLFVVDRHGRVIFEVRPVEDAAIDSGQMYAAAMRTPDRLMVSVSGDDERALLEYHVPTGRLLRTFPTGDLSCLALEAAEDGVWCLGFDHAKARQEVDFDVLHRFDAYGDAVATAVLRSSVPSDVFPVPGPWGARGVLLPSDQGVRLLGFNSDGHRVITVAPDGRELSRERLPLLPGPFDPIGDRLETGFEVAIGSDIVIQAVRRSLSRTVVKPDSARNVVLRLAQDASRWIPVSGPPSRVPPRFILVGADDTELILFDRCRWSLIWLPM